MSLTSSTVSLSMFNSEAPGNKNFNSWLPTNLEAPTILCGDKQALVGTISSSTWYHMMSLRAHPIYDDNNTTWYRKYLMIVLLRDDSLTKILPKDNAISGETPRRPFRSLLQSWPLRSTMKNPCHPLRTNLLLVILTRS